MKESTREHRENLMRTLVASTRDVTRAQREAAWNELRAMEIRRITELRWRRERIQRNVAAARSAVLQRPPGMTAVADYLVAAIAALADYIDEHHAGQEADSQDYLESLDMLRPAEEMTSPRVLDGEERSDELQ